MIPHMQYIDIGVNLTASAFSADLSEVINRAHSAGVVKMLVTGTDLQHSRDAVDLCINYPQMLAATAGVHPHHADDYDAGTTEQLQEILARSCVLAVGECGLDYNRNFSQPRAQRVAFEQQLELAVSCGKPVFLHQRDAHDDFVAIIKGVASELNGGVAHCFTGTPDQAEAYLEMGLHIGVTGWICDDRRAGDLRQAVRHIPLHRIMLETDAPYLLPRDLPEKIPGCAGYRPRDKRRNEPCFLPHVCAGVAGHMAVDAQVLAEAATNNARALFAI